MRRIIVAIEEEQVTALPVEEPVSALPVGTPPTATPVAEAPTAIPVEEKAPIFTQPEGLADLVRLYRKTKDNAIFEQILKFPYEGQTVQKWVASQLSSKTPMADAAQGMWTLLTGGTGHLTERTDPDKFMASLFGFVRNFGRERNVPHGPAATAIKDMGPFFKAVHDNINSINVDDETWYRVTNRDDIPDAEKAWELYKIVKWNDRDGRVEKAIQWYEDYARRVLVPTVQRTKDKEKVWLPIRGNDKKFLNVQKRVNQDPSIDKSLYANPDSPFYLTARMVDPGSSGIGPNYFDAVEQSVNIGNASLNQNVGKEEGIERGALISEENRRGIEPAAVLNEETGEKTTTLREEERRSLLQHLPESMLDFSANEEEKKKACQRESLVSPGGQHFPQVVTRAIHQLYDKNDTPLMYDFGVMYSKFLIPGGKTPQGKAISTKAAQDHNEALRRKFRDEHKLLLNDPDKFAAYTRFEFVDFDEDENYSTGQKEAMIFKEVVMQLLRFVTNDKNLESMDIPLEAVASIRSFLKMANLAAGLARNG